jgi:hypothetical protein
MAGIKGTHDLIQSRLLAEANNLKHIQRVCSLVVDDMTIKGKLEYNRSEDKFYGLPTIPTNNPMGKRPVLPNKLLCFVLLFTVYPSSTLPSPCWYCVVLSSTMRSIGISVPTTCSATVDTVRYAEHTLNAMSLCTFSSLSLYFLY